MAEHQTHAIAVTLEGGPVAPVFIPLLDLKADTTLLASQCTLTVSGAPSPLDIALMLCKPETPLGDPGDAVLYVSDVVSVVAGEPFVLPGSIPMIDQAGVLGLHVPLQTPPARGDGQGHTEYGALGGRMPSIAARQLITTALRLLGVASAEQPLSADMAQSGLEALNTLLDSWSTEKLLTYTRPKIALTLVPGQATYTWGLATPACDIPLAPPVRLELCLLTVDETSPGLEWPLEVLDQVGYEVGVWIKALASTYPAMVYLETSQPVALLHLWPVPTLPYTLQLLPWQAHSPYAAYDAVLEWPAGYQRAFQFNLAMELAPQYGVEPSPVIMRTAEESKRALYPINVEVGRLRLNPRRPVGVSGLGYPAEFLRGH